MYGLNSELVTLNGPACSKSNEITAKRF